MKIKTLAIVVVLLFFATGCYESGYHPTYIISGHLEHSPHEEAQCPR